jgi:hypothetical protein
MCKKIEKYLGVKQNSVQFFMYCTHLNNFQSKFTQHVKIDRAQKSFRSNFKSFKLKRGFSCSGLVAIYIYN